MLPVFHGMREYIYKKKFLDVFKLVNRLWYILKKIYIFNNILSIYIKQSYLEVCMDQIELELR